MKVCYKCFTEVEETVLSCPNCGVSLVGEEGKTKPDFPFGMRLDEDNPPILCTALQAGDEIIYNWNSGEECLQFFRGKQRIWLFKSGHWVKSILSNRFRQYDPEL